MSGLRRIVLMCIVALPMLARADENSLAIQADDGSLIANHRVPAEAERRIASLPGAVIVGHPQGKVTLAEFYDVNCPFCRTASPDIDALLRSKPELRLILVPFPILGIASIQATRVELAVRQLASPQKFYQFHRILDATRGTADGTRALAAAKAIGLDTSKVTELANDDRLADVMKAQLRLADALDIQATPGLVLPDVAILGYPGPKALAALLTAVGRCGSVLCGTK